MKFTIQTIYPSTGSGMTFYDKKTFMKELSLMIDDCISNGGTFFDIQIIANACCFFADDERDTSGLLEE